MIKHLSKKCDDCGNPVYRQAKICNTCFRNPEKAFTKKLKKEGNCLVWTGYRLRSTYGVFAVKSNPKMAHRVAWERHYGSIPSGLKVLHHCDNPPCCKISHLFLGTQYDNMQDMIRKGRYRNKWSRKIIKEKT